MPIFIESLERHGNGTFLFGRLGGTSDIKVHLPTGVDLSPDQAVTVRLLPEGCHLFDADEKAIASG